jgi:methyl-accepting chemotaxis protein
MAVGYRTGEMIMPSKKEILEKVIRINNEVKKMEKASSADTKSIDRLDADTKSIDRLDQELAEILKELHTIKDRLKD